MKLRRIPWKGLLEALVLIVIVTALLSLGSRARQSEPKDFDEGPGWGAVTPAKSLGLKPAPENPEAASTTPHDMRAALRDDTWIEVSSRTDDPSIPDATTWVTFEKIIRGQKITMILAMSHDLGTDGIFVISSVGASGVMCCPIDVFSVSSALALLDLGTAPNADYSTTIGANGPEAVWAAGKCFKQQQP